VILQPRVDDSIPAPPLRVEAKFAEFRGLDEQSAARRANIPRDPEAGLVAGACVANERFVDPPAPDAEDRELTLVEGGDLRLALGTEDLVVPLALVPDLLPWVSGVEYVYAGATPEPRPGPDGSIPLALRMEGSPDGGPGPIDLVLDVPPRFEILPAVESPEDDGHGALHLRWQPPGADDTDLLLQVVAHSEVSPTGPELSCLVPDSGQARLEVDALHRAGLARTELVRVTARRFARAHVSAGAFADIQLLIEMRDQRLVPVP
jgi:hypothetical protein